MKKSLAQLIRDRRILILCGTGGVGKTTLSATLAIRAAIEGKRAVVVTIDPAKRLATSLGLSGLGDRPHDLTPLLKARLSPEAAQRVGSLHALMPDTRLTFEQLIHDLGFDEAGARRVRENRIFKIFAREFSGTNEYMAMQKLHSIARDPAYDFIVLDTPPSRNTLDFLRAPELLSRFYEEKIFNFLVTPANKLFSGGIDRVMGLFEKLTGGTFVSQMIEFARSLLEVRLSFMASLKQVMETLRSPGTGFLLVASPTHTETEEIEHFLETVRQKSFDFGGYVINRSLLYLEKSGEPTPGLEPGIAVLDGLRDREQKSVARMATAVGQEPLYVFPELARDVHSFEDLLHVAQALESTPP